MRATELIAALQTLIDEYGDLDCAWIDEGYVVREIESPRVGKTHEKVNGRTWAEPTFDTERFFVLE